MSSRSRTLPDLPGDTTRLHRPFTNEDELGYSVWFDNIKPMESIEGNAYLPIVYEDKRDIPKTKFEFALDKQDKLGGEISMGLEF